MLRVPAGTSSLARADREALGERLSATARAGVDNHGNRIEFADLAMSFSDDGPTRVRGGDMGNHKPGDLAEPIETEAFKLDVGGVSPPFTFKNDIVIIKVISRDKSQLPGFEEAHEEVMQRTYGEQMDKARRLWIDELRHGTYVDVRL